MVIDLTHLILGEALSRISTEQGFSSFVHIFVPNYTLHVAVSCISAFLLYFCGVYHLLVNRMNREEEDRRSRQAFQGEIDNAANAVNTYHPDSKGFVDVIAVQIDYDQRAQEYSNKTAGRD